MIQTTKMDKIWIATATLLRATPTPASPATLVDGSQIAAQVRLMWGHGVTPIMYERHLVSGIDRDVNPKNPAVGGSRNRYLFRTVNGTAHSGAGKFRLYKKADAPFDAKDKTGPHHPDLSEFDETDHLYCPLVVWYLKSYF
ncbi:MAG: hypothetical protein HKL90_14085 [Elusimicrobia bacterium]|nr:hypothetical protein [Elusimicrobiota bacterium]